MNIKDLGAPDNIDTISEEYEYSDLSIGRVTQEHRERYIVSTGDNEYEAEITGNLRFSAASREDYPAVGDWVAMKIYDTGMAIIHKVLPRKSVLERQAVGKYGDKQIISTNIDAALIVQSIDNNFNINRLERYLSICSSAGIQPVLVISKIDLATEDTIREAISNLKSRDRDTDHILLSNVTLQGIDDLIRFLKRGKTYCVVGSSGVGKSTLINNLIKKNILKTDSISRSTGKGRHISDHRELFVLENGAILIDTPGMRELGITENAQGIQTTFQDIYELSLKCKFPDCRHINENGCAVLEAMKKGIIDKASLENFRILQKEQQRFKITVAEKRRQEKIFGKIIKRYKKDIDQT
ncbi:MAG: ribosome small subunit-dependent GTPase A [Bacteroidota bacterium]